MAENQSTLIKRVISGLLALFILIAIGTYGGTRGLLLLTAAAIILGIREYSRMAFLHWKMPRRFMHLHWAISLLILVVMYLHGDWTLLAFSIGNVAFICLGLWITRSSVPNENLLPALAMGSFGFLYCVLFPFYALQIVQLPEGPEWFLFLLMVVFFGDIFAYFSGRLFGRHKFMPMISPNKTWEGSLGGFLGSAVAGTLHVAMSLPGVDLYKTVLFCLVCGAVAQSGDLLMSLVKRVAQVKDSGTIMPGHGGILDRLDGIFIACPLVYAFALYVRT